MKHSIAVKFLAVLLCAASIAVAICSAVGIFAAEYHRLYEGTPESWLEDQGARSAYTIAYGAAEEYAAEKLGECPPEVLEALSEQHDKRMEVQIDRDGWTAQIAEQGRVVKPAEKMQEGAHAWHYTVSVNYPVVAEAADSWDEAITPTEHMDDTVTKTADAIGALYSEYLVVRSSDGNSHSVHLDYYSGPTYDVTVYLKPGSISSESYPLLSALYQWRYRFIALMISMLILFAATLVYLCTAAGRKSGSEKAVPAALNRIPLDLYLLGAGGGIFGLCFVIAEAVEMLITQAYTGEMTLIILLGAVAAMGIGLLLVGFFFALAAQVKAGGGYWWRHTLFGWFLCRTAGIVCWIGRSLTKLCHGCAALFNLLPVIWQWLLTAAAMTLCVLLSALITFGSWGFAAMMGAMMLFACIIADISLICYGAYCFGTLMKGARILALGDLNYQIPTRYLCGSFRQFANELNSLAGAAQLAAERQMKSERMKTELITNVSHDIKTPLTSIINYVDLLKKPHSDADGALYLEVLDRQSFCLKKLIDDLMEMSKASSGNISVEIAQVDAVEAVNQALGEFADKLAGVNLVPVFRHPDFPVTMLADGRLLWRVMSNLLGNAVKYALPDTRLYVDLMVLQGNAVIAVKNISREQLNVSADELMERFVRGDAARNTEGSGLGLNIAKSLVELQHGQMHLMVDGDLFKVTLIFPIA